MAGRLRAGRSWSLFWPRDTHELSNCFCCFAFINRSVVSHYGPYPQLMAVVLPGLILVWGRAYVTARYTYPLDYLEHFHFFCGFALLWYCFPWSSLTILDDPPQLGLGVLFLLNWIPSVIFYVVFGIFLLFSNICCTNTAKDQISYSRSS